MTDEQLNKKTREIHDLVSSNVVKYRNNVVKYRKLKNVSQLQLALDIGLSGNAFIARAEKRVKNAHFNIEHLVKISSVLEIDIAEFFK